jgi:hypothetical protein
MPMVDKIIEVNWYETPKLGIDASQPHLKQEKCASRREGAIFVMESKDIEETDRPWTWMVVDGERFSFDEVKRMYARYQKE